MSLKISISGLATRQILSLDSEGVRYSEGLGSGRRFRFHEIEYVLLSEDNILSVEVGNDAVSIRVKPGNAKHQEVIETLVKAARAARGRSAGA